MSKTSVLRPKQQRTLSQLGENLKLVRLRRKYSAELVAERANISRTTLWNIEKGEGKTSLSNLIKLLSVYGMESELSQVANDDVMGRKLQDLNLVTNKRAPKKKTS